MPTVERCITLRSEDMEFAVIKDDMYALKYRMIASVCLAPYSIGVRYLDDAQQMGLRFRR